MLSKIATARLYHELFYSATEELMTGRLRAGTDGGIEIRLETVVGGWWSAGQHNVYLSNYKCARSFWAAGAGCNQLIKNSNA